MRNYKNVLIYGAFALLVTPMACGSEGEELGGEKEVPEVNEENKEENKEESKNAEYTYMGGVTADTGLIGKTWEDVKNTFVNRWKEESK